MTHGPGAGDVNQQRHQIFVRHRLRSADVEDLPVAGVRGARAQERICRIVDVYEVPNLCAIAENLDLSPLEREAYEPSDEPLAIVLDELTRPVHVGEAERARTHLEHVVIEQMVVFAGSFVDAVDVDGSHEMV